MDKLEFIFDTNGDIKEINYFESTDLNSCCSFHLNKENSLRFYKLLCENCLENYKVDLGGYYEHDFYNIEEFIIKDMLLTEDNLEELGDELSIVEDDIELSRKYRQIQKRKMHKVEDIISIFDVPQATKNDGEFADIPLFVPHKKQNSKQNEIVYDYAYYDDEYDIKKINRKKRAKEIFINCSVGLLASLVLFTAFSAKKKKNNSSKPISSPAIVHVSNNQPTPTPAIEDFIIEEEPIFPNYETIESKPEDIVVISDDITANDEEELNSVNNNDEQLNLVEDDVEQLMSDENKEELNIFKLRTENLINDSKYTTAKAYYYAEITKWANTYGIDPKLALAICTHERGIHSNYIDNGGAIGLFQIQVMGSYAWQSVTAFNFNTNSWETVTITEKSVSDVFENIKDGCMIIQNALKEHNYDVPKAIQAYNYGTGNMQTVLNTYIQTEGLDYSALNDPYNLGWLKYRNVIGGGDANYLENVFKYVEDGSTLEFKKPDGTNVKFIYDNLNCDDYIHQI